MIEAAAKKIGKTGTRICLLLLKMTKKRRLHATTTAAAAAAASEKQILSPTGEGK